MKFEHVDIKELETLSKIIASHFNDKSFLYVNGDLGAGKTTFTKFFCQNFGIDQDLVSSPTFSIVNVYDGTRTIYHIDLYRIEDPDELFYVLEEHLENKDGIFIIEWSNLFKEYFSDKGITLNFYYRNDKERDIEILIDVKDEELVKDLRRWKHEREKVRKT